MRLKGVALSFDLSDDDNLMTLVKGCGYSKPTKQDPVARRELADYGGGSAEDVRPVVEIHRASESKVYVRITPGDFAGQLPHIVLDAWNDLEEAKLV